MDARRRPRAQAQRRPGGRETLEVSVAEDCLKRTSPTVWHLFAVSTSFGSRLCLIVSIWASAEGRGRAAETSDGAPRAQLEIASQQKNHEQVEEVTVCPR